VSELTFFMLPSTPVPAGDIYIYIVYTYIYAYNSIHVSIHIYRYNTYADHGAVLYCSADGAHWEVLGAVTAQRPSGTFR
jgi:hypothetical protein